MTQVSLSILSSNLLALGEEISRIEPFVDRIHYDVMDGHFVDSITFGIPLLKQLDTQLPIDVHLMVTNPEDVIEEYALYADSIYFHIEAACERTTEILTQIRSHGVIGGIVISPETTVDSIAHLLPSLTHILVMSVTPGAGGQKYLPDTLKKIKELKNLHPRIHVMVDGGMNAQTSTEAISQGADTIVSGSYLTKARDVAVAVQSLKN